MTDLPASQQQEQVVPPADIDAEREALLQRMDIEHYVALGVGTALVVGFGVGTAAGVYELGKNLLTNPEASAARNVVAKASVAVVSAAAGGYAALVGPVLTLGGTGAVVSVAWDRYKARKDR